MPWYKQCQKKGQSKLWVFKLFETHYSLNWMWLAQDCQTVNALMWVKIGKPKRNPLKGDSITDDATGGQQVKLRCHSCHSRTLKWYPWWTHLLLVKSLKKRTETALEILSNLSPHFENICFVVRLCLVNQVIIKSRQGCVTSCQLSQDDPRHFGMISFWRLVWFQFSLISNDNV